VITKTKFDALTWAAEEYASASLAYGRQDRDTVGFSAARARYIEASTRYERLAAELRQLVDPK
jgi:hypothetical protein